MPFRPGGMGSGTGPGWTHLGPWLGSGEVGWVGEFRGGMSFVIYVYIFV